MITQQKNKQLVAIVVNRIEECFSAHVAHSCQQYCSALLHLTEAQQYCFTLLTTVNNVNSKTLFNPDIQQAQSFWLCILNNDS